MFHQQNRYKHEHCVLFQLHVMIPHMSRGTIHFKRSNLFNKYENKARDCLGAPGTLWIVMRKKNPWVMVTSKNKSSFLFLLLLDILPRSHPLSISPPYFDPFKSQCFSMGIHLQTKKQSTAKYRSIFLENFLWVTSSMVQWSNVIKFNSFQSLEFFRSSLIPLTLSVRLRFRPVVGAAWPVRWSHPQPFRPSTAPAPCAKAPHRSCDTGD